MKKLTKIQKENLKVSLELICEETTSLSKVKKLAILLKNTNPKIEKQLETITEVIEKIQAVQDGDVIGLSAERLPETTDKQRKRKALILLLLKNWDSLGSEVTRLNDLYNVASTTGALSTQTAVKGSKIAATMKGPAGIITIIAAGIVAVGALLNNNAVEINVKNEGCPPIPAVSKKTIDIPGLKMPSDSIVNGDTDTIKVPGVNLEANINKSGYTSLSILGINKSFQLPYAYDDIIYNGQSLMDKNTTLELSKSESHELIIRCKR